MREFSFFMPTKLVFGQDVVKKAGAGLALGKKALIVTGEILGPLERCPG